ncbi:short chain dehydrogenase [Colletotrichum plurivorum]|uniref:Short chain dehydrogenase n=1 Tax=Colletotrichum plurivorum TaxID=2175906 RepID=A0A8H6KDY0_9PEZI|nr:short chain dehydrogenase [Colletotrichum plurivorum]
MSLASRAARRLLRSRTAPSCASTSPAATRIPNAVRPFHSAQHQRNAKPRNPEPREHPAHELKPPRDFNFGKSPFADFSLKGRVFIVTGGAQGLGLSLAEALVEAGGKVYCLDRQDEPHADYGTAQQRVMPEWGGSLHYRQADVVDTDGLDRVISAIADKNQRLDGVIAAAGINQITPAIDYTVEDINKMLAVNYTGVFVTAQSSARQMLKHKCHGSICLIASMSGLVANHGMLSPVYNSSKAAVIQLSRNLAMEWSPLRGDGGGGIRVNCISPGHILTPMVERIFAEVPGLREEWEGHNMFGRLADTTEFKGAGLFLMSNASTFMTGSNLVIDGGHTAW